MRYNFQHGGSLTQIGYETCQTAVKLELIENAAHASKSSSNCGHKITGKTLIMINNAMQL